MFFWELVKFTRNFYSWRFHKNYESYVNKCRIRNFKLGSRGQFHQIKVSVCYLSTREETFIQPKNMDKSFHSSSDKFCQLVFCSWFLPHEIDPWSSSYILKWPHQNSSFASLFGDCPSHFLGSQSVISDFSAERCRRQIFWQLLQQHLWIFSARVHRRRRSWSRSTRRSRHFQLENFCWHLYLPCEPWWASPYWHHQPRQQNRLRWREVGRRRNGLLKIKTVHWRDWSTS